MTTPARTALSIADVRASVKGRVIAPGDDGYDEARVVMLGGIDCQPAVIVRVAGDADVAAVIRLARETGLELAVRSGGHSGAAHSTVDDGIVLDLRDMKSLDIDVAARTAWAETGLTAAEVAAAAGAHGLAIGFGDTGSVGIGGITLGGGVGYLVRKYGLTIDDVLAADIVTADGGYHRLDADTEPELFWAIRGGGGNFGVVTRFKFRLHPVPSIVGGLLVLPATRETVAGFIAAADAAPDGLSTIANVMPCPPVPFVPAEHHGSVVIFAIVAYAGETAEGERVVASLRALATPIADMVKEEPYAQIYPPEDDSYHPLAITRTLFVDRIDEDVADTILAHLNASDASVRVAQLRVLGGAMARVPAEATAFAHRESRIMVNVASFYEGDDDRARRERWVTDLAAALRQTDHGAYVNFLMDEGEGRVRAAYPGGTWDRLVAVKTRYDATNLFHRNQNIPPTA